MNIERYKNLKPFERQQQNLFSFWFPKIKDCGIPVPESVIIPVPDEMYEHFYMDHPRENIAAVRKWCDEVILPSIKGKPIRSTFLFIKNGSFSNKFDAGSSCMASAPDIAMNIINIMYQDAMFDVGGTSELVVRERIPYDRGQTPCIYNGLPLRPEFRVFYDFDTHEVLFVENYWNYDYCAPHLYDRTDKIVFDAMRAEIEESYETHRKEIADLVAEHMKGITELQGPWSIDLMLTEKGKIFLIDMAVAEQSAYWKEWLDRQSDSVAGETENCGGKDEK